MLASDLQRYLSSRPVLARPQTIRYRAEKFVRRHRALLAAAAVVALSLMGGIAYSTYQARRAESRFQQVRQLANTFVFDIHDAIQPLPGSTKARQLLVSTGLTYLDNLAFEANRDPELQWELAQAYSKLGTVQGAPRAGPHLGDTAGALASHRKAIALLERLAGRAPNDLKILRAFAGSYMTLGDLEVRAGRRPEALVAFTRATEIARTIVAHPSHQATDLRLRGFTQVRIGDQHYAQGESAAAFASFEKALEDFRSFATVVSTEVGQGSVANGLLSLARAYGGRGEIDRAVQTYRETVRLREELANRDPDNLSRRRELAVAYTYLAEQLFSPSEFSAGNRAEAVIFCRKALEINEQVAAADPNNAQAQRDLVLGLLKLARALEPDDPHLALQLTKRAERISRARTQTDPGSSDSERIWIYSFYESALRLRALRRLPEALQTAERSLRLMEQVAAKDPDARRDLVDDHQLVGDLLVRMRNPEGTLRHYEKALELAHQLRTEMPYDLFVLREIADTYELIGLLHAAGGRVRAPAAVLGASCQEARAWFQKSLDTWSKWGETGGAASYRERRQREIAAQIRACE
ncbi:MAG: tetratricopeptide repeat protein [Candidatus Acidiferrales bacterium]